MKNLKKISNNINSFSIFNHEDPFLIEEQYSEEEKLVRDTAKQFAKNKLFPTILEANRNETFNKDLIKEFGNLGLLGPQIKGYGCAGVSSVAYGLIAKEIEK